MSLKSVIKRQPVTAPADTRMTRVIELLLASDSSLVVIVGADGRMVGLVTESSLLVAAFDPLIGNDPVSLHMERQFVSLDLRATVMDAAETFLLHRVRHLPVLENGKPMGIISRRDVLRYVMQHPAHGLNAITL
ncbi:MAG TPA: CBS domain-containing protein [Pirellulaceae bacterium]|nr:CBS domain-containing protein [Pirellulaceae bacterium]